MALLVILAMVDDDDTVDSQNNQFLIRLVVGLLEWLSSAEVIFRSL